MRKNNAKVNEKKKAKDSSSLRPGTKGFTCRK